MNIREFFWNYPDNLSAFVKKTAPISFLFIFGAVFFYLFSGLLSSDSISAKLFARPSNKLVEGTVGTVSNLNPLYIPNSQAERDIEALVFEKLIDIDSSGSPQPSIATKWLISNDYTQYKFTIGGDHFWHDGELVDADDVVYSFNTAIALATRFSQDTYGQSIQNLEVKKTGDMEVTFSVSEPNATLFESLSVYIVPEHILGTVRLNDVDDSSFSQFPVGSGPYFVTNNTDMTVSLQAMDDEASIKYYEYWLFDSTDSLEIAFRNGLLDVVSGLSIAEAGYLNEYGAYYNQVQYPIYFRKKILFINNRIDEFGNASIRRALNYLTNKTQLLIDAQVDGIPSLSSLPRTSWAFDKSLNYYEYNRKSARAELKAIGYTKDKSTGYFQTEDGKVLSVTMTYLDNPLNGRIAESLKKLWDGEGIVLKLDPISYTKMTKETLATRDFELLLYEIETTIDPDQYDLWHSLRVDYPYLNLSGYSYDRADVFLERARTALKRADRKENYLLFQKLMISDAPAIFLYEPYFNVIASDRLKGLSTEGVNSPSDRYNSVEQWYLE